MGLGAADAVVANLHHAQPGLALASLDLCRVLCTRASRVVVEVVAVCSATSPLGGRRTQRRRAQHRVGYPCHLDRRIEAERRSCTSEDPSLLLDGVLLGPGARGVGTVHAPELVPQRLRGRVQHDPVDLCARHLRRVVAGVQGELEREAACARRHCAARRRGGRR